MCPLRAPGGHNFLLLLRGARTESGAFFRMLSSILGHILSSIPICKNQKSLLGRMAAGEADGVVSRKRQTDRQSHQSATRARAGTYNPGMCLDRESNLKPFCARANALNTEHHQPRRAVQIVHAPSRFLLCKIPAVQKMSDSHRPDPLCTFPRLSPPLITSPTGTTPVEEPMSLHGALKVFPCPGKPRRKGKARPPGCLLES